MNGFSQNQKNIHAKTIHLHQDERNTNQKDDEDLRQSHTALQGGLCASELHSSQQASLQTRLVERIAGQ